MTTNERLDLLASAQAVFAPWTGAFSRGDLEGWLAAEFGTPDALDHPQPHGPLQAMVRVPPRLLHVVSGNTPHAAMQSLLRGLVLGAHNTLKLPSSGLPEVRDAAAALPDGLTRFLVLVEKLPDDWGDCFDRAVVFGDDDTIDWFRRHAPPHLPLVLHGQRLSIAVVHGDPAAAAALAARDVSRFDQRGCLSVHAVYIDPACGMSARQFGKILAREMDAFDRSHPRGPLTPSEAGAITNLRETTRFVAASHPDAHQLWESAGNTHWTVIHEDHPELRVSCLNRVVYVKPWPASDHRSALGSACRYLAAIALHPFPATIPPELLDLGASRICALGRTQDPSLFWHHDGMPPLASLVSWVDLG